MFFQGFRGPHGPGGEQGRPGDKVINIQNFEKKTLIRRS